MRIISFVLTFLMMAGATGVHALTSAECVEIKEKYGVDAPECAQLLATASSEIRTETLAPQNAIPVTIQQRQDHVFFARGGVRLTRDEIDHLERLATVLKTELLSDTCLQLVGHSDSVGSDKSNLALALRRSQAVADWLENAIGESRVVSVISQGEWQPLDNLSSDHRYQRRVEVQARRCQ